MDKIVSQKRATILITQKLQSQVTLLHSQCPTGKEWSGLLLCQITEGSIEKPDELEITCEEAFLMDLGDATFTSFEANTDWLKFFEMFPQVDPTNERKPDNKWYIGKIHSHHSMSAFHSGTDTQDLVENAPKLPFFLSLVVNYACNPFAEIAVAGEIESKSVTRNKWSLTNFLVGDNKVEKKTDKKPITYIIPCDVLYLTDQWLLDQVEAIKERNKPKSTVYRPPMYSSYDSTKDSKDDTTKEKSNGKLKEIPKGYRLMIDNLADLLTLGCGETYQNDQPAAMVYDHIDWLLNGTNKNEYLSAFKHYFIHFWYKDVFGVTNITLPESLICIRHFTGLDTQKNRWLTSDLNRTTYEIEEEVKLLRSVQGDALVPVSQ
jgi:proteasome lid subunit RPN8/RPN11